MLCCCGEHCPSTRRPCCWGGEQPTKRCGSIFVHALCAQEGDERAQSRAQMDCVSLREALAARKHSQYSTLKGSTTQNQTWRHLTAGPFTLKNLGQQDTHSDGVHFLWSARGGAAVKEGHTACRQGGGGRNEVEQPSQRCVRRRQRHWAAHRALEMTSYIHCLGHNKRHRNTPPPAHTHPTRPAEFR